MELLDEIYQKQDAHMKRPDHEREQLANSYQKATASFLAMSESCQELNNSCEGEGDLGSDADEKYPSNDEEEGLSNDEEVDLSNDDEEDMSTDEKEDLSTAENAKAYCRAVIDSLEQRADGHLYNEVAAVWANKWVSSSQ
jgi:hypothetical protein